MMRVVARRALFILNGLMLHFRRAKLLLEIIMAFVAELPIRFDEQLFVVRQVRVMAGDALTILDRLMFDLGRCEKLLRVFVAFEAELAVRFQQKLLLV